MTVPRIGRLFRATKASAVKNSPGLLIGFGITGLLVAMGLVAKDTPKAIKKIEKAEEEKGEKLTTIEKVKTAAPCYIIETVLTGASVAMIIGGHRIEVRRGAALAAAYSLSEATLKEYRSKAVEVLGEKKEKELRDSIAQDKVRDNPVTKNEVIVTGAGDHLCYDALSGRYFKARIEKIQKIENMLNRNLRNEMYISLNQYYNEIPLPTIKLGDDLGWNVDDGMIEFDYSSQLTDTGEPCLVIDFKIAPRYDFRDLH